MPCHDNMSYGGSYGPSESEKRAQIERQLCEARWVILRLIDAGAKVPPELRHIVKRHGDLQLCHRRDDKQDVVSTIKDKLGEMDRSAREIKSMGGEVSAATRKKREALKKKLEKVQSVTDAQLLKSYWDADPYLG